MAKVKTFKTIFPAVSVPLNDDYSINEPEFRAYLRWIKSFYGKGIEGLVCNGHTGEITGLTRAERKRVVEICSEECGDVMTIISGVNCENTAESIAMAKEAKEAGADGILLMPPHMWLRFGMNPNAPFEYVKDVAEGADIDIIIHLYARPAGLLVKAAKALDSTITLENAAGKSAVATKLMAVMGLGIKQGDTITVTVEGGDEKANASAMEKFFSENL